MTGILASAHITTDSGLPEDECENVWALNAPDLAFGEVDFDAVTNLFEAFYSILPTFRGQTIRGGADVHRMEFTDITAHLDGSPHGSPGAVRTFSGVLGDGVYTPLPEECAVVVTLHAVGWAEQPVELPPLVPGGKKRRPKQRYAGRTYFPLWNHNAVSIDAGHITVATEVREGLRDGLEALALALVGQGAYLSVWSRQDAVLRTIAGGYIDNAWDTVRSRGIAPTIRTTWGSG